jgi:hypothetical protein
VRLIRRLRSLALVAALALAGGAACWSPAGPAKHSKRSSSGAKKPSAKPAAHGKHEHDHLHPHEDGGHHHHSHPHPHLEPPGHHHNY